MKKIILLVGLLILPTIIIAQQLENVTTYKQESTIVLEPLLSVDADLYKNGILYDRVMPLANLREISSITETHSEHFKRSWQELYDARIEDADNHISISTFQQIATHYQKQGIIPVGIINIDFTQFTTSTLEALEEETITINQLANRNRATSNSPYEHKHLFLASPITNGSIKTPANTPVNFRLDALGLNQSTQNMTTLQVIFNNTVKTIVQNGALIQPDFNFNFTSSGVKTIQFKATFSNGQQLISNAKVNITIQYVTQRNDVPILITASEPFQGYDEPANCNGNCYGKGEYQVFLGKDNNNLQKPLIILDGFDPGDARKIKEGEGSIIRLIDNQGQENNMEKFYDAGFDVVILNFQKYVLSTQNVRFLHPFTNQYVNFTITTYRDGGADYIERNANVLKALIVKLNTELQQNGSTEKLKIIGPSMGGLISRVALTQMEKANQNHNTDIWVSFDSPHLGANIPIGLQYFFNFMELGQVEMLKTPAARQMLITQVVEQTYTTRNTFKNLLNSLGFPEMTNRNLALVNGSINGSRQGTPRGTMLELDAKIIGTLLGSLGRYQIKTFASHDGGRYKIFERYKRFLFFKNTHAAYLVDNTGKGSLDNAPGGTFDMENEFESFLGINLPLTNLNSGVALNSVLTITDKPAKFIVRFLVPLVLYGLNSSIYLDLHQGTPTFIPTKSSLAYSGSNNLWSQNLSSLNLVCLEETPFDSYYAPLENEPHITLNAQNMDWLTKELNNIPQDPTIYLPSNVNIIGSSIVCYNNIFNYTTTLGNTCVDGITWEISNNLVVTNNYGSNIEVSAISNYYSDTGWIKATFPNGVVKTRVVEIGKPEASRITFNRYASYDFQNQRWNLLGALYNGNLMIDNYNWEWQVPSSMIRQTSPQHSYINFRPNVSSNTQITIRTRASNECGCSAWKSQVFDVIQTNTSPCGGAGQLPCKNDIIEY